MYFAKKMRFLPPTADEELNFNTNTARIFAKIFPLVGDLQRAYDISADSVRVFYGTRGRIEGVLAPEDILRRLSLAEIAECSRRILEKQSRGTGAKATPKTPVPTEVSADFLEFDGRFYEKYSESGTVDVAGETAVTRLAKVENLPLRLEGPAENAGKTGGLDMWCAEIAEPAMAQEPCSEHAEPAENPLLKPFGQRK